MLICTELDRGQFMLELKGIERVTLRWNSPRVPLKETRIIVNGVVKVYKDEIERKGVLQSEIARTGSPFMCWEYRVTFDVQKHLATGKREIPPIAH